jgi:hypothetical protein
MHNALEQQRPSGSTASVPFSVRSDNLIDKDRARLATDTTRVLKRDLDITLEMAAVTVLFAHFPTPGSGFSRLLATFARMMIIARASRRMGGRGVDRVGILLALPALPAVSVRAYGSWVVLELGNTASTCPVVSTKPSLADETRRTLGRNASNILE